MSKKRQHKELKQKQAYAQPEPATKASDVKKRRPIVLGILIITLFCFTPMFTGDKEFTNWDDLEYVVDQPLVKSLSANTVAKMFDPETEVMLNYHPITMFSFALDYQFAYNELDNTISAVPFARTNLIFHLFNTFLVFMFIFRLSKGKIWVAIISALAFGIHPMHVESVAWISGRKDVLYCFFFLLSCIAYLRYLDSKKYVALAVCLLFFIASCLCKAMAVPLPFVLLLTDIFYKRKLGMKLMLEKLPFILFAIWIGYNTIGHQEHAIVFFEDYTIGQRIMFACYSFCMYLFKIFVPVKLSALYPYPNVHTADLPAYFYLMPVIASAMLMAPIYWLLKKRTENSYAAIWGLGFYTLMILLVLQFVTVGHAIIADRYTYVSYLGPFFVLSTLLHDKIQLGKYGKFVLVGLSIITVFFFVTSYNRVGVWQNSRTLWTDAISKYPYILDETTEPASVIKLGAKTAYKNLAHWYTDNKQYDSAFIYYNTLAKFATSDPEVWANIGNIYTLKGNLPAACTAFTIAVETDSLNYDNYFRRGLVYGFTGKNDSAIRDFVKTMELKPDYEPPYAMAAKLMESTGKYDSALNVLLNAIKKYPSNGDYYYNASRVYRLIGDITNAEKYERLAVSKGYRVNGSK